MSRISIMPNKFYLRSKFRTKSKDLLNFQSDDIGDPSLIGLTCESGEFSDLNLQIPNEPSPLGCEGILMFADNQKFSGSLCRKKKTK